MSKAPRVILVYKVIPHITVSMHTALHYYHICTILGGMHFKPDMCIVEQSYSVCSSVHCVLIRKNTVSLREHVYRQMKGKGFKKLYSFRSMVSEIPRMTNTALNAATCAHEHEQPAAWYVVHLITMLHVFVTHWKSSCSQGCFLATFRL